MKQVEKWLWTEHEEQVEALRLLVDLLLSADGKEVPVRIKGGINPERR